MEISHHYGKDNIFNTGCFIATIINNNEYCKKIIVLLPNQSHPEHYHKKKDETFLIISGKLMIKIDNVDCTLLPGQHLRISRLCLHSFTSGEDGCILEEISSTHYNDDSFYTDNKISMTETDKRKTKIINWVIV
jgi:N-acetylneuraminate synthase